ncbi:MAG: hypothetical protein ACPL0C_01950, partial [Candidatus Bathyarchaeales archaeon]
MKAIKHLEQRIAKFNMIICGSADASEYNPNIVFQKQIHKGIVIGLHKNYTIDRIAKSLNVSKEEALSHLEFLREAEFVTERNGRMVPTFFVALKEDVLRTKELAKSLGEEIGKCYEVHWDTITEAYCKLSVSSKFGFDR